MDRTISQAKILSFQKAVGATIRRIREDYELRQEELAAMARSEWGLTWTRATIAAIETGKRELSPVEFLLLRPMLNLASYDQLFPDNQAIAITPEVIVTSDVLKALFSPETDPGQILGNRQFQKSRSALNEELRTATHFHLEVNKFPKDPGFWRKIKQEAAGDAEQKAARKLGVESMAIAIAAYNLWNRSLSKERDSRALKFYHRWTGEIPELTADEGNDDEVNEWLRRRLQTFRGHATRELLRELKPILKRR